MNKKLFNNVTVGTFLLKMRTFIALVILIIFFSISVPNFFSATNIIIMTKHVAQYALLAIGMTFVIISGGIDLSVGSIVGLSAMLAGGLLQEGLVLPMFGISIYFNVVVVILIVLFLGTLVGAANGFLISYLKVPPFLATLGTLYIARGLALLRSGGKTFSDILGKPELGNTGFEILGTGTILGIPLQIWILVAIAGVAAFIAKKTPLGWYIYAIGGNERAAEVSGITVNKTKMFVYMFSGFCCAMVGLIVASQLAASHPATGETWELTAIASSVLGGTSLSGGIGTINCLYNR